MNNWFLYIEPTIAIDVNQKNNILLKISSLSLSLCYAYPHTKSLLSSHFSSTFLSPLCLYFGLSLSLSLRPALTAWTRVRLRFRSVGCNLGYSHGFAKGFSPWVWVCSHGCGFGFCLPWVWGLWCWWLKFEAWGWYSLLAHSQVQEIVAI